MLIYNYTHCDIDRIKYQALIIDEERRSVKVCYDILINVNYDWNNIITYDLIVQPLWDSLNNIWNRICKAPCSPLLTTSLASARNARSSLPFAVKRLITAKASPTWRSFRLNPNFVASIACNAASKAAKRAVYNSRRQ